MVWESIVSLLDYVIIIRCVLFLYAFMNNYILNSVCFPACTSALASLPALTDHTTPPMKPSRNAGLQGWGHHGYSYTGEYHSEWDNAPDHSCSIAFVGDLLCTVADLVLNAFFNINCHVRTSELHGLSQFSRTQMAKKNGKDAFYPPLPSSLHHSLP